MQRFPAIAAAILIFLLVHQKAYGDEKYTIDNQRVLLYKVINWWYDCLPEESTQLCGSRITYENRGKAQILYKEAEKNLILGIDGGFAELLSLFKQCKGCYGPSFFECVWLNRNYFGKGQAKRFRETISDHLSLTFLNVDRDQVRNIRAMKHNLVFVVEGVIGGLMDGQIALHQGGDLLKTCPKKDPTAHEPFPIRLILSNPETKEVLAVYHAVQTH